MKFEYLLTNYHIQKINGTHSLLNQVINLKIDLLTDSNKSESSQFNLYRFKTNVIIQKIKFLLFLPQVKNINDINYENIYIIIFRF